MHKACRRCHCRFNARDDGGGRRVQEAGESEADELSEVLGAMAHVVAEGEFEDWAFVVERCDDIEEAHKQVREGAAVLACATCWHELTVVYVVHAADEVFVASGVVVLRVLGDARWDELRATEERRCETGAEAGRGYTAVR